MNLEVRAEGPDEQSLTVVINEGEMVRIGRMPEAGLAVAWDKAISREHADFSVEQNALRVQCVEAAKNPIYLEQQKLREAFIPVGHSFRIGQTTFYVTEHEEMLNEDIFLEETLVQAGEDHTFSSEELQKAGFGNTEQLAKKQKMGTNSIGFKSNASSGTDLFEPVTRASPHSLATILLDRAFFLREVSRQGSFGKTDKRSYGDPLGRGWRRRQSRTTPVTSTRRILRLDTSVIANRSCDFAGNFLIYFFVIDFVDRT